MIAWILEWLVFGAGIITLFFLLLALFSPFESLGWWSGWTGNDLELETEISQKKSSPSIVDTREQKEQAAKSYVVYLSGILAFSGDTLGRREINLMERIAAQLPGDEVMIGDVFPYSVSNNPLNGERILARMWQWLKDHQKGMKSPVNIYNLLILGRNLLQVAVSADPRYGPLNNVGVAREIILSLFRHGYPPGSGKSVYLIGYSGGGQVAVGAARYLHQALHAPIYIIGLGAVFTDDPGIASVEHLFQVKGKHDFFPWIGMLLFPGCWPILRYSVWNRARREGRITIIDSGAMFHFGRRDYFSATSKVIDGTLNVERTASLIVEAIRSSHSSQREAYV